MMKSGTNYEQGDIVLALFPFTDLTTVKQRPVLILSNNDYNSQSDDLVTCGITSNLKDSAFSKLINNKDLIKGQIPIESRIKVDKLFTLDKTIIKNKIAKVKSNVFEDVKKELLKLL